MESLIKILIKINQLKSIKINSNQSLFSTFFYKVMLTLETKYSKVDQVKFEENCLQKI